MNDNAMSFNLEGIDPRTWAKIERRAKILGKTPEELASIFLEESLGSSCKSN